MPTVGKGDKAAEFPYTEEGMEAAEDYAQQTNQEIDYSPGGTKNAPDMRESYHMGGQVPGQPEFGKRPGQQVKSGYMNNMLTGDIIKDDMAPNFTKFMKKGGKVKK